MSGHPDGHHGSWLVVSTLLLASIAAPTTAPAADFTLVGDGSLQHLNYYGASGSVCQNSSGGTIWATDGRISNFRGTLDWTGQGKLEVVARVPLVSQAFIPTCSDGWRALNAEDFPLEFAINQGDPAAFLRITPRLVGSVVHSTGIGGQAGTSTVTIIMRMSVSVNGEIVSQDELVQVSDQTTGQSASWTPAFPKGDLNMVTIPGAAATGSQVTVDLFAYTRVTGNGTWSALATSLYGNELALLITAEAVGPVGVAEADAPKRLSLGIRPNPSPARTRVSYTLPRSAEVELALYDVRGARRATLVDRVEGAGRHEVALDRSSTGRGRLEPGVYIVQLRAGRERRSTKLVLTE